MFAGALLEPKWRRGQEHDMPKADSMPMQRTTNLIYAILTGITVIVSVGLFRDVLCLIRFAWGCIV